MYLKDKLEDDELDLSMMQLTEIPVKEIEQLGTKVLKLNLSHNLLTSIPANLPLLTHITSLDISKNQICELPENFGQLTKLRTLDLYSNKISKLPVSFAQLKNLKWLDLKENPLVPELAKSAGPCLTKTDCELAAKKVVARLQSIESQLFQENKKRIEMEEKARRQKAKKEEEERERIRLEKKLAKEKRREEARQRDAEHRTDQNGDEGLGKQHNGNYSPAKHPAQNGHCDKERIPPPTSGFSCIGLLVKILLFCVVGSLALGVSLLWLYTDGKMDSNSIQRAVPVIQKDVERTLVSWGDQGYKYYQKAEKASRPYVKSTAKQVVTVYEISREKATKGYSWLNDNYGDTVRSTATKLKEILKRLWAKCEEIGKNAVPFFNRVWSEVRPWLEELGRLVIEKSVQLWAYLHSEFPVYIDWLSATGLNIYQTVHTTVQKMIQAMN